jgi:hypothetical protein
VAATVISDVTAIAKILYDNRVPEIGFSDAPAWGMLRKTSNFFGESKAFSSRFTKTPGKSRTFSASRSQAGPSRFARWLVTRANDFITVKINVETFEALGNTEGAQTNYVEEESDSAYDAFIQRVERNLFRNRGGSVAQIASGGATQTITVVNAIDLCGIDVGDYLDSDTTDGSGAGAARDNTTEKLVTAINRVTGTITTSAASWDADGGFGDDDYLFLHGDLGLAWSGLDAWIPSADPGGSDSFFGLNRSVDPQRLAGIRYVASAGSPDGSVLRALNNAGALTHAFGGRTSHIFMNSIDFGRFVNDLGNNVQYHVTPGQGIDGKKLEVLFSGVKVMLPSGPSVVYPNRHCQRYTAWMLDYSDFSWEGLKTTPRWMDMDGGKWLRMAQDDIHGLEGYLYAHGQFVLRSPGKHARVDLQAVLS